MVVIRAEQDLLLALTIKQVTREVRMFVENLRMYLSVATLYRVK
jgi:hypothetical protein